MKVEDTRPNSSSAIGATNSDIPSGASRSGGSAGADSVRFSADLHLVTDAVRAADITTVRPEAVRRGQALLESGELGSDVHRLADRLLDAMVYSHDTDTD